MTSQHCFVSFYFFDSIFFSVFIVKYRIYYSSVFITFITFFLSQSTVFKVMSRTHRVNIVILHVSAANVIGIEAENVKIYLTSDFLGKYIRMVHISGILLHV